MTITLNYSIEKYIEEKVISRPNEHFYPNNNAYLRNGYYWGNYGKHKPKEELKNQFCYVYEYEKEQLPIFIILIHNEPNNVNSNVVDYYREIYNVIQKDLELSIENTKYFILHKLNDDKTGELYELLIDNNDMTLINFELSNFINIINDNRDQTLIQRLKAKIIT